MADVPDDPSARAVASGAPTEPSTDGTGAPPRCGRFVVLGVLGTGGMGVVLAAHDPDLDRPVAIKLLHAGHDRAARAAQATRLTHEARVMARLAHPHVVTVYEVGAADDDRIFIAMERVDGTTLRGWLARPRSWRAIVAMFVEAGRGLVAAHELGVVHRDFKPDNVLIGADGRPRVTDFGVAATAGETPRRPEADATALTSFAGIGTPAYMAPEQWTERAADPHSDQFAFCVALWEALYGERPFAGTSARDVRDAVLRGEPRAVRRAGVPRGLHAALRRGLAADPAARWPDLARLLDALARYTRRPRGWAIAAVAVASASATAIVALNVRSSAPQPCADAGAGLVRLWSPVERARIELGFRATGGPLADATWALLAPAIDRWGERWAQMRVEACEATEVRREQSPALMDLRMSCLDDRRRELAGLLAAFAHAAPGMVANAVKALGELEPIARCADTTGLTSVAPPRPERRLQVDALKGELAEITAVARLRVAGNIPRAERALAAARALGYPPLEAEALFALSRTQKTEGAYAAALDSVEAAALAADQVGDDRLRVRAWSEATDVAGSELKRGDESTRTGALARAALARIRDPGTLAATVEHDLAGAAWGTGRYADGLREVDATLATLAALGPEAPPVAYPDALNTRGLLLFELERYREAIAEYQRARSLYVAALGPDHPFVAATLSNLANALSLGVGDHVQAEAMLRAAIASAERAFGPDHPQVATYLNNLVNVLIRRARFAEALPLARRAVDIRARSLPADHPYLLRAEVNLATVLAGLGKRADAERAYVGALAIQARKQPPGFDNAYTRQLHAENLIELSRAAEAERELETARQIFLRVEGADSTAATLPLAWLARAATDAGDPRRGLAIADQAIRRAIADRAHDGDIANEGLARWHRARALVALDRRGEAVTEARAAIASLAQVTRSEDVALRDKIERWLASWHPAPASH